MECPDFEPRKEQSVIMPFAGFRELVETLTDGNWTVRQGLYGFMFEYTGHSTGTYGTMPDRSTVYGLLSRHFDVMIDSIYMTASEAPLIVMLYHLDIVERPLSVDEIRSHMDGRGMIHGIVRISMAEAVRGEYEEFLDLLSMKLTGTELLTDISYNIVGTDPDSGLSGEALIDVWGRTEMMDI